MMKKSDSLGELISEAGNWGARTFGTPNVSRQRGIINHLRREIKEMERELKEDPTGMRELADCFISLLHLAYVQECLGGKRFFDSLKRKFYAVSRRKYGPPDEEGVCEHFGKRKAVRAK